MSHDGLSSNTPVPVHIADDVHLHELATLAQPYASFKFRNIKRYDRNSDP